MKPSNLQTKNNQASRLIFRAKVLNLKQGSSLNDKSERLAELLLLTFPHNGEVFLFIWQVLRANYRCFYSNRTNFL